MDQGLVVKKGQEWQCPRKKCPQVALEPKQQPDQHGLPFLDDWLPCRQSQQRVMSQTEFLILRLKALGQKVNHEKSHDCCTDCEVHWHIAWLTRTEIHLDRSSIGHGCSLEISQRQTLYILSRMLQQQPRAISVLANFVTSCQKHYRCLRQ